MMLKPSIISLLIILSGKTFAEFSIPGIATSSLNALYASDKTLAQTGISQNIDDISSDQDIHAVQLSAAQIHEAKV
ncbi:MAG: hypothetical protein EBY22_12230 [Gammaproteobacteria bacterium]|nr:hypothetical protein [Gammaproteobacteria bacterium]